MAAIYPMIIAFSFMTAMLLAGMWLRAKISFLRTAPVPARLIGGFLRFALVSMGWSLGFDANTLPLFTFVFFTLSFMPLMLIGPESGQTKSPSTFRGGM